MRTIVTPCPSRQTEAAVAKAEKERQRTIQRTIGILQMQLILYLLWKSLGPMQSRSSCTQIDTLKVYGGGGTNGTGN